MGKMKTPAKPAKMGTGNQARGTGPATLNAGPGYKKTTGTRGPKTTRVGVRKR